MVTRWNTPAETTRCVSGSVIINKLGRQDILVKGARCVCTVQWVHINIDHNCGPSGTLIMRLGWHSQSTPSRNIPTLKLSDGGWGVNFYLLFALLPRFYGSKGWTSQHMIGLSLNWSTAYVLNVLRSLRSNTYNHMLRRREAMTDNIIN